jgi:hypothetical protein
MSLFATEGERRKVSLRVVTGRRSTQAMLWQRRLQQLKLLNRSKLDRWRTSTKWDWARKERGSWRRDARIRGQMTETTSAGSTNFLLFPCCSWKEVLKQKIRKNRFEMIVDCEARAYENVRSSLNLRCFNCGQNLINLIMLLIKLKRANLATRNWMLFAQ